MPTYSDNVIFDTAGRDVGSPTAPVDLYARDVTISGAISLTGSVPSFAGALASYTKAGLPVAGTAGRLARVTDNTRGVWMDQGAFWLALNGQVVNVREFGARGDNVTDDTVAIQNAINAQTQGLVFFPPGDYVLTAKITVPVGIYLQGSGSGTSGTVLRASHTGTILECSAGSLTTYLGAMRDFYIRANPSNPTSSIRLNNVGSFTIDNVRADGATGGQEILIEGTCTDIAIRRCFLQGGTRCITISGTFATSITIRDCYLSGATTACLLINSTSGVEVCSIRTIYEGATGPGIKIEGSATGGSSQSLRVYDGHFEANTGYAIDINPSGATAGTPNVCVFGAAFSGNSVSPGAIRMNQRANLLVVEGITTAGHTSAGIDLPASPSAFADIFINGNRMSEANTVAIAGVGQATPNYIGELVQFAGKIMVALTAMGGGAAPTFGTIGGSGPATAAQNAWAPFVDVAGNLYWVPVWK